MKYSNKYSRFPRSSREAFGPYGEFRKQQDANKADRIYLILTVGLAVAIGSILALGV